MELLYTCVSDPVTFLHRTGMDELLAGMEHYYDQVTITGSFTIAVVKKPERESARYLQMLINFFQHVKGPAMKVPSTSCLSVS